MKKNLTLQKKILILRFSSIGDIVLTTPVVRCLKKQIDNIEIHYLTKPAFTAILANNPYIDKVHVMDKHPIQMGLALRKEKFDLVIDLHHNLRTAMIKAALGVEAFSFPKLNIEKFLLVNFKVNKMPSVHIVDRYLETTKGLGVINDGAGLDYFIPLQDSPENVLGFRPKAQPYFTWAIGAQHFTKRLPNAKIIEKARLLEHPVVLLGGKEDMANAALIQGSLGNNCIDLCGKINLNQSAWVVKNSLQLFTNDTGLMHIAAALKVPTISFWGNTVPAFGMTPYYGAQEVEHSYVENTHLSCRPCSKIGFQKCPKGHFNCMNQL